ncbi:MAG: AarF/UbiB family protein [Deltaproteobacteria bacterium]|nr:AarF/UbiB family protein [Deltaproteobacteria bacterium]
MRSVVHAWHIAVRSAQIAAAALRASLVFLRQRWALRGRADATPRAAGRALVDYCTRVGATFIKIGQIASTRADLLPRPLVEELAALQDRVPPFPFAAVRETVERELGQPLDAVYSRFDPEPVAAASVAQVHRAVLRSSGDVVAVKVRRPDIVEKVQLDRAILLALARAGERVVPSLRLVSLEMAVRAFCAAVEEQLHFTQEAANNARFTANFAADPDVDFPPVYPAACADAVLTMGFVDGVREAELDAHPIDVRQVVTAGMRCVCRMIFSHGFVHADLHAGNLRFFPPGRVVLLDLGLVGRLDDEDRLRTAETLYAFASGDGRTVARLFYDNAPYVGTTDYDAYEREVIALVESLHRRGLGSLQVTLEIGRIFDVLRRHKIHAKSHMTMVNLALMAAEGLGKRLAPDLSLTDAALPYLSEALAASPSAPTPA